jgi:Antibiotic biosynthesis monooxygenase
MQHLRMATYEINKGTFQEVAESARTGMLPKFREQPGFVRYGVADLGDKTCMSISVWETREQAEAAAPVAAAWVGENLADRIELQTHAVGALAFFTGVPATV